MNSSTSVTEKSNGQNCSVKKSLDLQIDEAQKLVIQELRKMNSDKQAEIDRLNEVALNKSIEFEQVKNALSLLREIAIKQKTQINVLSGFLDQFLSDYEGMFDHEKRPTSIEMAENFYLPAAKYMAEHFGRTKGHRIDSIQEWIDNQ
jgi:hypothetical protein